MSCLVSYDSSSSESSDDDECKDSNCLLVEENKTTTKRHKIDNNSSSNCKKLKLPIPDAVKDMYKDEFSEPVDDPTSHDGRIRTFAHERGNWASFVFMPYNHPEFLTELTEQLIECLKSCGEFHIMEDFHASLSRTFVVRHHWIDGLLESLRINCKQQARKYSCELSGIQFYCNDECTRTFLGLTIDVGTQQLKSFVSAIDRVLLEYKLPVYYKDPSFHISVAWAVGDVRLSVSDDIKQALEDLFTEYTELYPLKGVLEGTELFLKTGNKSFNIPLS